LRVYDPDPMKVSDEGREGIKQRSML
jgi:hypothetical protein